MLHRYCYIVSSICPRYFFYLLLYRIYLIYFTCINALCYVSYYFFLQLLLYNNNLEDATVSCTRLQR